MNYCNLRNIFLCVNTVQEIAATVSHALLAFSQLFITKWKCKYVCVCVCVNLYVCLSACVSIHINKTQASKRICINFRQYRTHPFKIFPFICLASIFFHSWFFLFFSSVMVVAIIQRSLRHIVCKAMFCMKYSAFFNILWRKKGTFMLFSFFH